MPESTPEVVAAPKRRGLFTYVIIVVVFICVVVVSGLVYRNNNEKKMKNTAAVQALLKNVESKNSSVAEVQEYVKEIDTLLNDKSIVLQDRLSLLLLKANIVSVSRSGANIQSGIEESSKIYQKVYELSKGMTTLTSLNERSLFGLVYTFSSNCFARKVTGYVPTEYVAKFYVNRDQMTLRQRQQAAFRTMLSIAYGDETKGLWEDRSLVSHRIFILSAYISSYKEDMPTEEYNDLLSKLKSDLDKFATTYKITLLADIHTEYVSKLHYAFAYDIYQSLTNNQQLSVEQNTLIDSNYNLLRESLTTSTITDKVSLGMVGMMNDTYHLASLHRRYAGQEVKEKVAPVIISLKANVFSSPEVTDITKAFYNYGLSEFGQWFIVKHHIFTLANENAELLDIMKLAGVSIESTK